ncbi:hypothetical protein [Streptomyces sp. NPDC057675]|uniref:hypothetical protein n=1 Tax=Streptomyces sp. NPDC057675 TaxID=3346204 RepID=UPI0036CB219C
MFKSTRKIGAAVAAALIVATPLALATTAQAASGTYSYNDYGSAPGTDAAAKAAAWEAAAADVQANYAACAAAGGTPRFTGYSDWILHVDEINNQTVYQRAMWCWIEGK